MKRAMRSVAGALSVVALAWVSFSAQGCKRPGIRDVCVAACECVTDAACEADSDSVEVCVTYAEAEQTAAQERGCAAEFDDYVACYGSDYQCPTTSSFCKTEVDAYQACVAGSP